MTNARLSKLQFLTSHIDAGNPIVTCGIQTMSGASQGVPYTVIEILVYLYEHSKGYIKLGQKGGEFRIGRGVKQGDPLSPNIFNCLLEYVFRKMDWDKVLVKIDGRVLNNLRYVDDIVLVGKKQIRDQENGEGIGIRMQKNKIGDQLLQKSKFLGKDKNEEDLVIQGSVIECVNEYKYLG